MADNDLPFDNMTGDIKKTLEQSSMMLSSTPAATQNVNPLNGGSQAPPSPVLSDSAFTATPIACPSPTTVRMQNHAAIQRSSALVQEQVSALSRKLSIKSNGSHGSHDASPGILSTIHQGEETRGERDLGDCGSNILDTTNNCTLEKSGSAKSARSYTSLRGIGTYQVGTLRVHSPSPTRSPIEETHPCMKDGDVFVVRDIPAGVVFGYDTRTISIKEPGQFEGIKNLPAGAHLIWASSDITSLRTGYWIMTSKKTSDQYGEIFVRGWDQYNEVLDE
jgi:A1 cistron-splicing factor AAR2